MMCSAQLPRRFFLFCVFWISIGGLLGGCSKPSVSARVATADQLIAKGDLEAAVVVLRDVLAGEPQAGEIRYKLGRTLLKIGSGAAARKELEAAQKLGIHSDTLAFERARAILLAGDPAAALIAAEEAKPEPETVPYLIAVGDIQAAQEDFKAARAAYMRALKRSPNDFDANLGLARLDISANDPASAEAHLAAAAAVRQADPDLALVRGALEFTKQDYAKSRAAFEQALAQAPYSLVARLGLVRTLLASGHDKEALENVDAVLKRSPQHPEALYFKAYIVYQNGKLGEAIDLSRKVLSLYPNHAPTLLLVGSLLYQTGQYEQASKHVLEFLKVYPNHYAAHRLLAALQLRQGRPADCIRTLEEVAADEAANDANYQALLGMAYAYAGKNEAAIAHLEKARTLQPDNGDIALRLSLAKLAAGQTETAIAELEALSARLPDYDAAKKALLDAYLRQRRWDDAMAAARRFLEARPQDPVLYNMMATAQVGKGDLAAARATLRKALDVDPKYVAADFDLANLDLQEKKPDDAKKHLNDVLARDPKNGSALMLLGQLAAQAQDPATALAYLERARNEDPDNLKARLGYAQFLLELGRTDDALAQAYQLQEKWPTEPGPAILLGEVFLRKQQPLDALKYFEALTAANPESVPLRDSLGRAQAMAGHLDAAKASFLKVLAASPKRLPTLAALAGVYLRQNDLGAAHKLAEQCKNDFPAVAACAELSGDVAFVQKDYAGAAAEYQASFKAANEVELLIKLFKAKRAAGQSAEGLMIARRWLDENPRHVPGRLFFASAYEQEGKLADAVRLLEEVAKIDPKNPAMLNNLAWLYRQTHDARALDFAKRAYDTLPDSAIVADTYGLILAESGQAENGLKLIEGAVGKEAANPGFRYHQAIALARLGDAAGAKQALAKALEVVDFPERKEAEAMQAKLR